MFEEGVLGCGRFDAGRPEVLSDETPRDIGADVAGSDIDGVFDGSGIGWEEIPGGAVEANIGTGEKVPADGDTAADEKMLGIDRGVED